MPRALFRPAAGLICAVLAGASLPSLQALQSPPAPTSGQQAPEPPAPAPPSPSPESPVPEAGADLDAPLAPAERETLLRLAWQVLVGHLTNHPIQDKDLESYALTPRLVRPRGCFVTLKAGGTIRGRQGEIEPTRPLYQQVIVFTRRAGTRDPRFLPLTDLDLGRTVIEIAVIGKRTPIAGPQELRPEAQGVFLEKWGRRALFLPGVATEQGWSVERTLQELCRQASLPANAWSQGARLEAFDVEMIAGPRPAPEVAPQPGTEGPPPPTEPAPGPVENR